MEAARTRTPARPASRFTSSLIGMVSSLIVWAAYFVVAYVFLSVACAAGLDRASVLGFNAVQLALAGLTVVTLGAIAAIAAASARAGRAVRESGARGEDAERRKFISRTTALIAGLAFVAALWVGAGTLMLAPCA